MKVLQADSIIIDTRKLWRIFPIKQKFDTAAAFFWDSINFVKFGNVSDSVFIVQLGWVHNGRNIPKFDKFDNIYAIKKSCRGIKFLFNWKNSP